MPVLRFLQIHCFHKNFQSVLMQEEACFNARLKVNF